MLRSRLKRVTKNSKNAEDVANYRRQRNVNMNRNAKSLSLVMTTSEAFRKHAKFQMMLKSQQL